MRIQNKVDELLEWNPFDTSNGAAWDDCRAIQLLGMFYTAGLISRGEMDQQISRAGRILQRKYRSWEMLCERYPEGYAGWRQSDSGAEQAIEARRALDKRLTQSHNGPYGIPWDTALSWNPEKGGSSALVRKRFGRFP